MAVHMILPVNDDYLLVLLLAILCICKWMCLHAHSREFCLLVRYMFVCGSVCKPVCKICLDTNVKKEEEDNGDNGYCKRPV